MAQAYCVKCRTSRDMQEETEVVIKGRAGARKALQGKCGTCGTKLTRITGKA